MMALDVAHRCRLVRGGVLEVCEMVSSPQIVEPLRKLRGHHFEKVLIQRAAPAGPNLNLQTTRPRKEHVAILNDVSRRKICPGSVCACRVAGAQLGNLDD